MAVQVSGTEGRALSLVSGFASSPRFSGLFFPFLFISLFPFPFYTPFPFSFLFFLCLYLLSLFASGTLFLQYSSPRHATTYYYIIYRKSLIADMLFRLIPV